MYCARAQIRIATLIVIILTASACKKPPIRIATPTATNKVVDYVARADASMQDAHLYAWRQAESLYQKAYALLPSEEIRKKLLLAHFLIFVRQMDEGIPYSAGEAVMKELCAGDSYEKNLCAAAEWIQNGRKAGQLRLTPAIFRGQDPALESYIILLLFQASPRFDAFSASDSPAAATESPLFLYLNSAKLTSMDPGEFEKKYPQFAEGYECLADHFYQKKQYRKAMAFYQRAVDIVPEYANALIGLGNLTFYVLEDYARAMRYYNAALKQDSSAVAALFGKSLVLQQLGEYTESNATLDRMLAGTIARNQWIDGVPDTQYYRGEGNYLKAYNYYLMKDSLRARDYVDTAAKFLPDAAEIRYLSGLLHYEAKKIEPARLDFLHVSQMGNFNCNAQLTLGFIYEQFKGLQGAQPLPGEKEPAGKKSLQYFAASAGCTEAVVGSLSYQIHTLNTVDLDPQEMASLKARLEQKLSDTRLSSISTIEATIDKVASSTEPEKELFLKHIKDILTRLRAP
jgi:tetratricopeptide (TPR) repeat protein